MAYPSKKGVFAEIAANIGARKGGGEKAGMVPLFLKGGGKKANRELGSFRPKLS